MGKIKAMVEQHQFVCLEDEDTGAFIEIEQEGINAADEVQIRMGSGAGPKFQVRNAPGAVIWRTENLRMLHDALALYFYNVNKGGK